MPDCRIDPTTLTCTACGASAPTADVRRNCTPGLGDRAAGFREHPADRGVGTELHKMLSRMGISETSGCKCKSRVALLNQWGPQRCAENIETIVEWLKQEAGKRGLPFMAMPARILVRRAISNAKKNAAINASNDSIAR